eukprot:COSAG06_NODE_37733_length_431_cov_2.114458_2_plen_49_part_01
MFAAVGAMRMDMRHMYTRATSKNKYTPPDRTRTRHSAHHTAIPAPQQST